jgi:MOSC domain-containing protein YiiM
VTGPRIPCATLSGRVGDGRFAARFAAARRPGAYVRVISVGVIAVGDQVDPMAAGSGVTLLECRDGYYDRAMPPHEVERLLAAPIASRFRTMLETRLDREGRR